MFLDFISLSKPMVVARTAPTKTESHRYLCVIYLLQVRRDPALMLQVKIMFVEKSDHEHDTQLKQTFTLIS